MSSEGPDQEQGSTLGAVVLVLLLGVGSAWWIHGHPQVSTETQAPPVQTTIAQTPSEPEETGWRKLVRPAQEDCLAVGSQDEDLDFMASEGISEEVVRQVMDEIVQEALRCTPDEGIEDLSLEFSIRVGCSGVVDRVEATRSGGASQSYVDCVADVLGYADFPGHDMPDGMEFRYPVTVEF
jgi:hypothetical protein